MNISLRLLWILVLIGGSSSSFTTENKDLARKLNDLCETYVVKLQSEECEMKQNEMKEMREKIQELQAKLDEGKLKDNLINTLQAAALESDNQIKDLKKALAGKGTKNHAHRFILTPDEEQQRKNITDFLDNQIKSYQEKTLKHYQDQLEIQNETISKLREQISSRDTTLINLQNIATQYETQFNDQEKTIEAKNDTIYRLNSTLMEYEKNLTKLRKQIEKTQAGSLHGCNALGGSNGIHNVKIPIFETIPVLCNTEIAGPGWTVIQQRINGEENFTRSWETYKNGFGNFSGDFFLGLETIHRLTNAQPHELYIYIETFNRGSFYARYDKFSIAGEEDKYRLLSLGSFSGNGIVDKMSYHVNQKFSTFDSDNDELEDGHCAKDYNTGWWYKACGNCNLNGKYFKEEVDDRLSNWWYNYISLKTIKMLIHPRNSTET